MNSMNKGSLKEVWILLLLVLIDVLVEAQAFLSEAHHMSNIHFIILMKVVSYFYMTLSQFSAILVFFLFFSSSIGIIQ